MWCLIIKKRPHLVVYYCWVHQSHLMAGNYLAINEPWMAAAKLAVEIIKWFNNHQTPLNLLSAQLLSSLGKLIALLLPVLTRWGSNYCAIRRLLSVQAQIQGIVFANEKRLIECTGKKKEQKAVAKRIIETVKDPQFWKNLRRSVLALIFSFPELM
ncbi:hypothetical protein C8F01DRAFT_1079732 [Mycena amicta]|nr:hypothetical protein C8F01DRAFT_1079732 [Mycena amicta]